MESELQFPLTNEAKSSQPHPLKQVVVCRGRSCRKYSAEKVYSNFKENLPPDTELISVPCLGQCGNGPMVLIEPEQIWYAQVQPKEVKTAIEQHIIGKTPVKGMLYRKFHK